MSALPRAAAVTLTASLALLGAGAATAAAHAAPAPARPAAAGGPLQSVLQPRLEAGAHSVPDTVGELGDGDGLLGQAGDILDGD